MKKLRRALVMALLCCVFGVTALAGEVDYEALKAQIKEELRAEGLQAFLGEALDAGMLIEAGGAWVDETEDGDSDSDLALTTVEVTLGFQAADWIYAAVVFLYEDPTFGEDTDLAVDQGMITLGNPERGPFSLALGKMYVPFGQIFTRFPDDPLVDGPVTLTFGECSEKTVLVSFEKAGIVLSAYAFNGDVNEDGGDDHIESFGGDINYTYAPESGETEAMIGVSYLSNVADTDGVTDSLPSDEVADYIGGLAAYVHVAHRGVFCDAEYMSALNRFEAEELATASGKGARPAVWNVELGADFNFWKPLTVAIQYGGSNEASAVGVPETRYGIAANQEIHAGVIFSVGYLYDVFDEDVFGGTEDTRNTLFTQLAIEF